MVGGLLVSQLLTMEDCIDLIDDVFRQEAAGKAENRPTVEITLPRGVFRLKTGAVWGSGVFGYKAYVPGVRRASSSQTST